MRYPAFLLLAVLVFLLVSCNTVDYAREKGADLTARINEAAQIGLGVTRSTDGWWYLGVRARMRPSAGSDSVEEREREYSETPIIYPQK